jgi:hypothetical protein
MVLWQTRAMEYRKVGVAVKTTKAVVAESARMLTGWPLQSLSLTLSVSLSQLFLLLPLRPRVLQTDVR